MTILWFGQWLTSSRETMLEALHHAWSRRYACNARFRIESTPPRGPPVPVEHPHTQAATYTRHVFSPRAHTDRPASGVTTTTTLVSQKVIHVKQKAKHRVTAGRTRVEEFQIRRMHMYGRASWARDASDSNEEKPSPSKMSRAFTEPSSLKRPRACERDSEESAKTASVKAR